MNKEIDKLEGSFEIIDLWAVHQGDTDTSRGYPSWFFDNEQQANRVAAGRGWWGGTAPISKHKGIQVADGRCLVLNNVFDNQPVEVNPHFDQRDDKFLQRTLKKLNDAEKEALKEFFADQD